MFFDLGKIGSWLGNRLSPNVEDLTDEQLQGMKKDDLVNVVKELQYKNKQLTKNYDKITDKITEIFMKLD